MISKEIKTKDVKYVNVECVRKLTELLKDQD